MREFIVAFRSRSEAVRYHETLRSYRVPSKMISTPSAAKVGCGLSVKLLTRDRARAGTVLERGKFTSVAGIFYILPDGSVSKVR